MPDAATVLSILNALAGPAGAIVFILVLFITVGFAIYRICDNHLLPFLTGYSDAVKDGFKDIASEMKSDREYHRDTMTNILGRQDKTELIIQDIKEDLDSVKDDVKRIVVELDK